MLFFHDFPENDPFITGAFQMKLMRMAIKTLQMVMVMIMTSMMFVVVMLMTIVMFVVTMMVDDGDGAWSKVIPQRMRRS